MAWGVFEVGAIRGSIIYLKGIRSGFAIIAMPDTAIITFRLSTIALPLTYIVVYMYLLRVSLQSVFLIEWGLYGEPWMEDPGVCEILYT